MSSSDPNTEAVVSAAMANSAPFPPTESSCPPPLQWQEVLQAFQQQANHWTVERPGTTLSGVALGEGPPLIFLNSLFEPRESSFLLAWLLRDQYRCVLFDWRGVRTPNSDSRVTLDLLVEDLFEIVDHWPGQTNQVIATGLGGLVALRAMHERPRQFRSLGLIGGYAQRQFSFVENLLVAAGRVWPFRVSSIPGRQAILRQNHRRWFPPFDETRYDFLAELTGTLSTKGVARLAAVVGKTDLRPILPAIENPVLLIGTEGQGTPLRTQGDLLARMLPNVRREDMHNTGLIPALTHPHRVAKLIRGFFVA